MTVPHLPLHWYSALLAALGGCAFALTVCLLGGHHADMFRTMTLPATLGAGLAGLSLNSFFGQEGPEGVSLACVGWPLTTLLGSVIATLLLLLWVEPAAAVVPSGIVLLCLGPIAIGLAVLDTPGVVITWLICGVAMHKALCRQRRRAT
ncbi:MAG: hypothetical protein AAFU63_00755 [Pseudomonadota bacterium]